eukprot:11188132-Lingulodinium_polyedra.AAC.1
MNVMVPVQRVRRCRNTALIFSCFGSTADTPTIQLLPNSIHGGSGSQRVGDGALAVPEWQRHQHLA